MREKVVKIIISILSGFGFTVLVFIILMSLLVNGFGIKSEGAFVIFGIIMGTTTSGILSAKIYSHLRK